MEPYERYSSSHEIFRMVYVKFKDLYLTCFLSGTLLMQILSLPQDSVFGILYMISKDPFDDNNKIGALKILFDFLQMLIFLLSYEWGWDINYGHR